MSPAINGIIHDILWPAAILCGIVVLIGVAVVAVFKGDEPQGNLDT